MSDPTLEAMCAAWWDVHASRKWADCPEEWKEHYRANMRAATAAIPKLSAEARKTIAECLDWIRNDVISSGGTADQLAQHDAARAELEALP